VYMKRIIYGFFIGSWIYILYRADVAKRSLTRMSQLFYTLGYLWITLFSRFSLQRTSKSVNLSLFKSLKDAVWLEYGFLGTVESICVSGVSKTINSIHFYRSDRLEGAVLNILLFIPLRYLLPSDLRLPKVIFICIILSVLTETIQYITRLGWWDLEDIFNNLIGTIIGIGIYEFLGKSEATTSTNLFKIK